MPGRESIKQLETGAGSALLISQLRLNLSIKIHLERKIHHPWEQNPSAARHKSRGCCSGRRAAAGSGLLLAAFSLDSERVESVA